MLLAKLLSFLSRPGWLKPPQPHRYYRITHFTNLDEPTRCQPVDGLLGLVEVTYTTEGLFLTLRLHEQLRVPAFIKGYCQSMALKVGPARESHGYQNTDPLTITPHRLRIETKARPGAASFVLEATRCL